MNTQNLHQRTIKIKINLDEDQKNAIMASMNDTHIVFDLFTKLACEHRSCSYITLHKYGYEIAKQLCPDFPTTYIQSVASSACGAVKSFNSNNKKKKWKYKGKKHSTTIPLNKKTIRRRGGITTFSSNGDRIKVLHDIPQWFIDRYQINTNDVQAGSIYLKDNNFYLCLVYRIEGKVKQKSSKVIGVDRGLYNFC
ncbi:MAG: hypothetical protein L0Y61_08840, partial [Epsilonproteobacteria bacterium]|nr:hypothetical protein [Campylobacterota bacterium]